MPAGDRIRQVTLAAARALHSTQNVPVQPFDDGRDVDRSMWSGYSDGGVVRVRTRPPIDRPIGILPTNQREPVSDAPNTPIWVNSNNPPWVTPPNWGAPVAMPFTACVPWYEVSTLLAPAFTVPQDYMLIIKEISYEALNAALFDTFTLQVLSNNQNLLQLEDMFIDNTTPNPAMQYANAGHFRPVPANCFIDRGGSLTIRGTLRGPIDINGVSPYFPGQPITSTDCMMKVVVYGYLANLRENADGGPRPTDLGDFANLLMDSDQSGGAYP